MSALEALTERAKKVTEGSRHQVITYVGANDYLYERARRSSVDLPELPSKLSGLTGDGIAPLRHAFEALAPRNIRETMQHRIEAARDRREEFANRGEVIVADWKQAAAVKDANSLITTVRHADGPAEIAKSVRTWLAEPPIAKSSSKRHVTKPAAAKAAVAKQVRKATADKPIAP